MRPGRNESMHEREGLIGRIRQLRRTSVMPTMAPPQAAPASDQLEVHALEARIAQLEQLVVALQDSVHRESARRSKQLAELEIQSQPAALGVALSRDARERGL